MRNFNHYQGNRYDAFGELDGGLVIYSRGERMDLADVWPGKQTDLASLERNAAAFRRQERRRFFAKLRAGFVRTFSRLGGFGHVS